MKKSIWNKGLFFEGLRRLRGLIITFSALYAAFIAVFTVIKHITSGTTGIRSVYIICTLLIFVFIGAPALAMRTFSFLNKRGSSDFFHALPYTRTCVFLSLLSSLIVGIAAVIAVSSASAFAAYTFLRADAYTLRMAAFLMFCFFASSVFTASICVLAASASGSVFTELVMSAVMMIFPPVLIYLFRSFIESNVYTAVKSVYLGSGSMEVPDFYSLPLRLFILFFGGNIDKMTEPFPLIYSAIVCVLYLVGAYLLFRFRKSETAGRSAPSPKIQAVFRVILACGISFIGTLDLVRGIMKSNRTESYIPTVIIIFSIAVTAYFIFELISTKGKRNILKAVPGFAAVIALNIAFAFIFYGVYSYEYSFGTKPEQISSMTVFANTRGFYSGTTVNLTDTAYVKCLSEGYKINGDIIVEAVCGNIKYANKYGVRSGAGHYMSFDIKCGLTSKIRSLDLFSDVEMSLKAEVKQSEKYRKYLKYIPSQNTTPDSSEVVGIVINGEDGKKITYGYDNVEKVLYALRAELKDVDADEWESFIKSSSAKKNVYVQYYSEYGYMIIALSDTLTPNAYKAAMEAWEEH